MQDDDIIAGDDASKALLAGLENEDQKLWFQTYQSAQRPLQLSDIERSADAGAPEPAGAQNTVLLVLAGLGALCALAGAFPGPAAGLLPLAMDILATLGPILAALFAVLVGAVAIVSGRKPHSRTSPDFARRRVIFPGSGPMVVQIGEIGLQLQFPNRFWRVHWTGFDAASFMARDLNGGELPIISKAQAGDATLATLFTPDESNPAVSALIENAAIWAQSHAQLRLPLKIDPGFAARAGEKGPESLAPLGAQREFILIDERFFEAPNESGLTWARFVAACAFMIQLKDPSWIDEIADPAAPAKS